MFIKPMAEINDIAQINNINLQNSSVTKNNTDLPFSDVFKDAVDNVVTSNQKVDENNYKLATGQMDDLHNLQIDLAKAQLSVDFMVQLRNKALESYNEIMRINL